jgi:hypothetical protein
MKTLLVILAAVAAAAVQAQSVEPHVAVSPAMAIPGQLVTVDIALNPNLDAGRNADWFVAAQLPSGTWYHFHPTNGWRIDIATAARAPLSTLAAYRVLAYSALPEGTTHFYFAVDFTVNGRVNAAVHYDVASVTVVGDGDEDGDGLSDIWEVTHFGDLAADADGDPDTDGLTNAEELALGTDPNLADTDDFEIGLSALRVRNVVAADQAFTAHLDANAGDPDAGFLSALTGLALAFESPGTQTEAALASWNAEYTRDIYAWNAITGAIDLPEDGYVDIDGDGSHDGEEPLTSDLNGNGRYDRQIPVDAAPVNDVVDAWYDDLVPALASASGHLSAARQTPNWYYTLTPDHFGGVSESTVTLYQADAYFVDAGLYAAAMALSYLTGYDFSFDYREFNLLAEWDDESFYDNNPAFAGLQSGRAGRFQAAKSVFRTALQRVRTGLDLVLDDDARSVIATGQDDGLFVDEQDRIDLLDVRDYLADALLSLDEAVAVDTEGFTEDAVIVHLGRLFDAPILRENIDEAIVFPVAGGVEFSWDDVDPTLNGLLPDQTRADWFRDMTADEGFSNIVIHRTDNGAPSVLWGPAANQFPEWVLQDPGTLDWWTDYFTPDAYRHEDRIQGMTVYRSLVPGELGVALWTATPATFGDSLIWQATDVSAPNGVMVYYTVRLTFSDGVNTAILDSDTVPYFR